VEKRGLMLAVSKKRKGFSGLERENGGDGELRAWAPRSGHPRSMPTGCQPDGMMAIGAQNTRQDYYRKAAAVGEVGIAAK
jgi:hypothetical protein